jgi:hypothetical protein
MPITFIIGGALKKDPEILTTTTAKAIGADSATISKPSGTVSGDLLLLVLVQGANAAPNGWTGATFTSLEGLGIGAFGPYLSVHYRIATGTDGTSYTTDMTGSSVDYVAWCARIGFRQGNPEGEIGSGTSAAPDCPSITPSWGTGNQSLLLSIVGYRDDTTDISALSYPDNIFFDETSGGIFDVCLSICTKNGIVASDDPSANTLSASEDWVASTIAVRSSV